ncbi:MAG TPA: 1-deoxy-D-xylulose-5-phosphate reductoisomerase, partial [Candidatus Nanopelagicaceae bacterium]
ARRCGALGGSVTAMFNAANEVAVDAFLKKLIPFTAIIETVEKVISRLASSAPDRARDISDVTAIENDARRVALEVLPRG